MEARTVSGLPTAAPHHDVVRCLLAIELSKSSWIVAVHAPLSDRISRYMLEGCDWKGLPELIERIRKRVTREFGPSVEMISCYEASYDVARQSGCVLTLIVAPQATLANRRWRRQLCYVHMGSDAHRLDAGGY
jgi:hypothetical protein